MAAHSEPLATHKRLDSWKEIATFFGRDERTVKRWEKERGLPVYRVPGSARGGVFAYAHQLDEWLNKASVTGPAAEVASAPYAAPENDSDQHATAIGLVTTNAAPHEAVFTSSYLHESPATSSLTAAKPFFWLLPLALIVASFVVFSLGHREPRFKNALAAPHAPNTEAQDLYLKGRYYFEKRKPDDLNKAVDFFTQAIVHDPAYAAPYVGLADTYNLLREYSTMPPQEAFPRALAAARKAVELDPNSAEAHNSLAFASFWGFFDATTADREFKRAIELDATLPRAHHWYATFLVEVGRAPEALTEIEKARQLDPSSTPILADKGFILSAAGKNEEARTLLSQLCSSQPEFIHPHRYLAAIFFDEGNYSGYFQELRNLARLRHDAALQKNLAAEQSGYEKAGLTGLLQARLHAAQESFDRGGSAFALAESHAAVGHHDDALRSLEIAYQRHDLSLSTLDVNPSFLPLHSDPEFRNLAVKVGLPPIH
jgi:tetratricopeptide (TPR) repeat protein